MRATDHARHSGRDACDTPARPGACPAALPGPQTRRLGRGLRAILAAGIAAWPLHQAAAQIAIPGSGDKDAEVSGNLPVTFEADRLTYDREGALVTAEGHVQAWQGARVLRADKLVYNRQSNTAAAYGHVALIEPSGDTFYGDYAELTGGMKDGVLRALRAQLPENAKLAANGVRRSAGGVITDLSRVVYTPCDVCANDPKAQPLWQIRAERATRDLQHQKIEYENMWLDMYGLPVAWFPYFWHADPSVKRRSGLLVPGLGLSDRHLGSFFTLPYYWVLDDASDVTLVPLVATKAGPQLEARYRRAFNAGNFNADGAIAVQHSNLEGFIFTNGLFAYDDTWRYGFSLNAGSSVDYLRDYRVLGLGANVLGSSAYVEGFGVGSYARLDARAYQALNSSVQQNQLPYVLPHAEYDYFGEPDVMGGRVSFNADSFNILRDRGTSTQRVASRLGWDRIATGPLGDRWQFTLSGEAAAYHANFLDELPNYAGLRTASTGQGFAQAAVKLNWPFLRNDADGGAQLIEPIVQAIMAPQAGNSADLRVPNEDSLDYEFTDSTLFSLNRFSGYDRHDGGARLNFALHGAWYFPGGESLDALAGASLRQHIQSDLYPQFQPWNGFDRESHLSDLVGRVSLTPNRFVDFTLRGRFDHKNGTINFGEAVSSFGPSYLRGSVGYIYSRTNPFNLYTIDFRGTGDTPDLPSNFFHERNEISAAAVTRWGRYSLGGDIQSDLASGQLVGYNIDAKYEDECFIFDLSARRRYTSINFDRGSTTILFTITFKTLGQVNING